MNQSSAGAEVVNGPDAKPIATTAHKAQISAEELLARCQTLNRELETFRAHLKTIVGEPTVESSHFRNLVRSELRNLERAYQRETGHANGDEEQAECLKDGDGHHDHEETPVNDFAQRHVLNSSNLPFLETIWSAVKNTSGLLALNKAYFYGPQVPTRPKSANDTARRPRQKRRLDGATVRKNKIFVDIVARDGLEWTKVSLVTNHRILMDKAREGWVIDSDDDSSSDANSVKNDDDDDVDSGIPIVRTAEALVVASKLVRLKFRHPSVRLILPKIIENQTVEVDRILNRFRALGISVECGPCALSAVSLDNVLDTIVTNPTLTLSPTVNIDCTILLALVSDFSHIEVKDEPWFHRALKRQIEMENKENLLPHVMYPALQGRDLVCTAEAAKRMREIVATIGTPGEKTRTALFLADESDTQLTAESRRARLKASSRFDVPAELRLPIRIVNRDTTDNGDGVAPSLPQVATAVSDVLSPINRSVFMYGWQHGITTITSNRTVVKQVQNILESQAESEKDWPKIWLCPTARSLVGKEKNRRA